MNGVIPHLAMVDLFERVAKTKQIPLQRGAQVGILTDLSYMQLVGEGVASVDMGCPMRYSHSARKLCDLNDLVSLAKLLDAALYQIGQKFSLNQDDYT